ncbi:MAG: YitT family protein [Clostridia bacterium]|nr:YitT family protein [Clostridia bacterium]
MKILKEYLLLTLGSLMITAEVYFFEIPNGFAVGGVSGLGTILGRITPIRPGIWIVIFNALLLLLAFLILGKETGIRTVYCTIVYSGATALLEIVLPLEQPVTSQPVLEMICAILLAAVGSAILFRHSASSGGTDIVALIMKKYTKINVGTGIFIADFLIASSAFFVFGPEVGIFSVIGLVARALFIDAIIDLLNQCKYFIIITEKPDEITDYVLNNLGRGATITRAEGAYSGGPKTMLHTVCKRFEAYRLKKAIYSYDPSSFIIVTSSSEIHGEGFMAF